ncbi:hypothetical protein VIGAN_07168100 [Vigna angularis var. angularis]|uniref:Uncharacterized protein n=1 Tax=Vigna angularis var. angularis TaxID=157739 RepID=A0A0S3SJ16_PHAAN|nr:hypothetical protein VIGAN_07168100 [Vigna angularis var. angularis]
MQSPHHTNVSRFHPLIQHLQKRRKRFFRFPILLIAINHRIPRNNIPATHPLKHQPCILHRPTFEVHVQHRCPNINHRLKASSESITMDRLSNLQSLDIRQGWQNSDQRDGIWLLASLLHLQNQLHSPPGKAILCEPRHHRVPRNQVPLRHSLKHLVRILDLPALGI